MIPSSTPRRLLSFTAAAGLLLGLPSVSHAYEVWLGLHGVPAQAASELNRWQRTANQVTGINAAKTLLVVAPGSPAEAAGYTNPTEAEYATIVGAFAHSDTASVTFGRSSIGDKTEPASTLPARIAAQVDTVLATAFARGYVLKYLLVHDEPDGNVWSVSELELLRAELDGRGLADIEFAFIARANTVATQNMISSAVVDHVAFEISPQLWLDNKGNRVQLLQWIWGNPALNGKKLYFHIVPSVDAFSVGTNEYASIRLLVRLLGQQIGAGFLASPRVIFQPTGKNPVMLFHPDTAAGGTRYRNSKTGLALSLIEQRATFEAGASETFCRSDVRVAP